MLETAPHRRVQEALGKLVFPLERDEAQSYSYHGVTLPLDSFSARNACMVGIHNTENPLLGEARESCLPDNISVSEGGHFRTHAVFFPVFVAYKVLSIEELCGLKLCYFSLTKLKVCFWECCVSQGSLLRSSQVASGRAEQDAAFLWSFTSTAIPLVLS